MIFSPGESVLFWWRAPDGYPLAPKYGTVKSVGSSRVRVHVTEVDGCEADYYANVKPENLQKDDRK